MTSRRPDHERVVATAWGALTPLGPDVESSFAAMAEGRSGIRDVTRFDTTNLFCTIAGELEDAWLWPEDHEYDVGGTGWRVGRQALHAALAMRPLDDIEDRARIGVVLGGHGQNPDPDLVAQVLESFDGDHLDLRRFAGDASHDSREFLRRQPDTVPALLARAIDARGPIVPIVSACAAGSQAIGESARMLRAGTIDVAVCGGFEPLLSWTTFFGFSVLGALTRRYPSPQEASRPFDRKRNGFVIAEGGGVIILETLAHAKAAGRTPLGEVLGYGDSADAYRITDPHPRGAGAVRAMKAALADAGLAPDAVEYVNAHGTSTAVNDPVETAAIKEVLGDHAATIPVSSNKSMIGHTIGGAGALEAIMTWRGMQASLVLPTINLKSPDRRCDLDYVPNEARDAKIRTTISNSFGFGGTNGSLILRAFD